MRTTTKQQPLLMRAAATLLLATLMLAAAPLRAWADTETVSYIDADGNAQTVTATVLTGNEEPNRWGTIDLAAGWYVVKGNISYTNQISYGSSTGTIHIILADGAQMSVECNDKVAISPDLPLAIYGQSAGTGRLSVTSDRIAIYATGGITINGGIVSATSTGYGHTAIYANYGAITINGGQVTATPGDNAMGISTEGTITLGLRSTSDFITANGYYGTVNIKDGQALKDPSGNIYYGTLTDAQKSAIANVTLQPATQAEFIAAALPQTAADTYTISDAAGWNVFCDLLADNTKGYFSGKTVRLGADITVTRMAGGSNHAFTGTFDGGGHTLTVAYGTADAPVDAQFVAPFVETAADGDHQPTFRNLTIDGHIYAAYTGSADPGVGGLIGHLFGTVTIEGCTSTVEINSTRDRVGGFVGLCEHAVTFTNCKSSAVVTCTGSGSGFVGWSRASAYTIAFEGCLFDGKVLKKDGVGSGNGGFVGWKGFTKTIEITNCLVAPAALAEGETMASDNSATFCRFSADTSLDNQATTITNSYYTAAFDTAQGTAPRTVTAGADVTVEAVALTGTPTQYTVSGITAYANGGLKHGTTLYYGKDDQLELTLSNSATGAPRGYQYGYTASAGTLSGTTLTMPDEDVTISVNTAALAPIDWATVNKGNSADPYMIYNKDQLLLLAHRVNGTNGETANDYYGMYFKLGADITFDPDDLTLDEGQSNYEAIGGNYNSTTCFFYGNFDGDGHTVSGIRINKTGSGDADYCQGLFGCIYSGANIHDVHLTDARITGYANVGGIASYNVAGSIMRCTVTDSYITATRNRNYGTICGTNNGGTLTNNYYHGCTVNGTAVTSGMGCQGADIAANNGALPAYRLDLGANITTPPGTFAGQTEWLATPPEDARLAPENGFTLAGNHYFASGYVFTPGSTLASGAAQGYTPRATLGDVLLDPYTPTGDADPLAGKAIAQFTVTADCDGKTLTAALRSDGQQHDVSYTEADGTTQTAQAIALDGTETSLAAGTYFAGLENVNFDHTVNLTGDVNLILADGCTMNIGTSESRISGHGIKCYDEANDTYYDLTICGQTAQTGALNIYTDNGNKGIYAYTVTINGGHVTIDANGNWATGIKAGDEDITINGGNVSVTATGTNAWAIYANCNLTINGGNVNATGGAEGIRTDVGDVTINGGNVSASGTEYGINASYGFQNITLGWTRPDDRITVSSIRGTVAVADGQALTDGSGHIYTGTLTASDINGKTLKPHWAGNGSSDSPYIISRTQELDLLAHRVNGTHGETLQSDGYDGKYFRLGTDIAYNHDTDWDDATSEENNYEAIGGYYDSTIRYFRGHFDGAGHTVSGIRIHRSGTDDADQYQGIFGQTDGANIHGLRLADARITGYHYTGGIVGYDAGTVTDCHVANDVCIHAVQPFAFFHGGIAGYNYGTVANCTSAATLTILYGDSGCLYYGAIAGYNYATLSDNLAIGATVPAASGNTHGAIAGYNGGTLERNYYTACKVASENITPSGVGCQNADVADNDGAVPALRDDADNSTAIALLAALAQTDDDHPVLPLDLGWGEGQFPLQLAGRTLYKDGSWNTLCLPFSVDLTVSGSVLDGAVARPLDEAYISGTTLHLTFGDAVATLVAGTPYIIKWDAAAENIVNPVFEGVTVSTDKHDYDTAEESVTTDERVRFVGTYKSTAFDSEDTSILLMGAANTLYYPTTEAGIGTHRAYFKIGGDNQAQLARRLTSFSIDFGENDNTTGIISISSETRNNADGWYSLDGRKLAGKPTQNGIYINNGTKVVIK